MSSLSLVPYEEMALLPLGETTAAQAECALGRPLGGFFFLFACVSSLSSHWPLLEVAHG